MILTGRFLLKLYSRAAYYHISSIFVPFAARPNSRSLFFPPIFTAHPHMFSFFTHVDKHVDVDFNETHGHTREDVLCYKIRQNLLFGQSPSFLVRGKRNY